MSRSAIIAAVLSGLCGQAAAADAPLFYRDEPAKDAKTAARDRILIFMPDGALFRIDTRLRSQPLKAAMKAGYFLYCGSWSSQSDASVAIRYRLLEAFGYKPSEGMTRDAVSQTLTAAGAGPGWPKAAFVGGDMALRYQPRPPMRAEDVEPIRKACRASGLT